MKSAGSVDLHTHGIGRYDTRTNKPENILRIAELHGKAGTRAIMPTVYAASLEKMRENIGAIKKAMEMQGRQSDRLQKALILGAHLEGPFLNPAKCGALAGRSFVAPSISSLRKLIGGYEDIIKIITIAPEVKGALKVIGLCAEMAIRVNMGHSDATFKQALEGKKAGATGITHIFNAMRPLHHREPGLAGLGLLDEDLYIEVIADGIHLHPRTLEMIFSIKRLDRIMLVSDSVKGDRSRRAVYDKKGVLSGSSRPLSAVFSVLQKINIPDAEILEASEDNPARYIGLAL